MTTPLYEVAGNYRRVLDYLYDSAAEDGAIPADVLAECTELLRSSEEAFEEKVEACCQARAELAGVAAAFKAEEQRISARRKALDARLEWLQEYIFGCLTTAGRTSDDKALETGTFRLKICRSPPKLEIYDLNSVPSDYDAIPERQICNKAVKEALASGSVVPGARIVQGTYLKIS